MVRKLICLCLIVTFVAAVSLASAGGPVAPYGQPCGPGKYGPGNRGPQCAYWGDAPFPGMCGGVVALPFLVVGSLLGANTTGPCGPPPSPRYNCAPVQCAKPLPYKVAPKYYGPPGPYGQTGYGTYASYGSTGGGGLLGGLGCFEMAMDLFGSMSSSAGLLY